MKSHFAGTVFRLPFRTKENSQDSSISKVVFTEKHQKELCTQFKAEARQWLLFPSSIRHIRICFRPHQARRSWERNGLLQQGGECARWQSRNAIIWQNSRRHGHACDWTITSALPTMCVCNYSVCIYSVCACCLCMQLLSVQLLCMRLWRSSQTICISTVVFYDCAHNRKRRDRFCGSLRQALLGLRL